MYIKKILKIENVWKFKLFSSKNDDLSFRQSTLIFWYNTYGKSTLTSIFRSMKENNKDFIIWRKTFGISEDQCIEIQYENWITTSFSGTKRNNNNIEIFDKYFINKNVFYWDEISKDEQANLYEILISEEIKTLKALINEQKEIKNNLEKERDLNKKGYIREQEKSWDDFIDLKIDLKIDSKVKALKDKLLRLENKENLQSIVSKTKLKQDFETLEQNTFLTLDESIETTLQDHINHNWNDVNHRREFINEWVKLLKDDKNCVFCWQEIQWNAKDLIKTFKKIFSDQYELNKKTVKAVCNEMITLDISKELLLFQQYWALKWIDLGISILLESKNKLDIMLNNKKENLNLVLNLRSNEDYIRIKKRLLDLKNNYLEQLDNEFNDENETIEDVRKELKSMNLIQSRHEEWIQKCSDYIQKNWKIENLKKEISANNDSLKEMVDKVFASNFESINHFLNELNADFSLIKFNPIKNMASSRSHYCEYEFIFNNIHKVNPTNKKKKDDQEPEMQHHFKNTLSESDKQLLAISFFLSKLHNDENLWSKITIFDDPVSSFDDNRKEKITNLLRDIVNKEKICPKQIIILTHDKSFCELVHNAFKTKDLKTMKINNSIAQWSFLQTLDMNEFLKDDFFRNLEEIKTAHETSEWLDNALTKRRKVVEHILKRKYYFNLKPETIRTKSIGEYLKEIPDSKINVELKQKLNDLKLHEELHDKNSIYQKTDPAKILSLKDTLDIIQLL